MGKGGGVKIVPTNELLAWCVQLWRSQERGQEILLLSGFVYGVLSDSSPFAASWCVCVCVCVRARALARARARVCVCTRVCVSVCVCVRAHTRIHFITP